MSRGAPARDDAAAAPAAPGDGEACGDPSELRGGAADLRCGCGSLLARLVEGAVELKCRRCKRIWTVPLSSP